METCVSMLWQAVVVAKCHRVYMDSCINVVLDKINGHYNQWITNLFLTEKNDGGRRGGGGGGTGYGPLYIETLLKGGFFVPCHSPPRNAQDIFLVCRATNKLKPLDELTWVSYEINFNKLFTWDKKSNLDDDVPYLSQTHILMGLDSTFKEKRLALVQNNDAELVKRRRLGVSDPKNDRLYQILLKLKKEEGPMYISKGFACDLIQYSVLAREVLEFLDQ